MNRLIAIITANDEARSIYDSLDKARIQVDEQYRRTAIEIIIQSVPSVIEDIYDQENL